MIKKQIKGQMRIVEVILASFVIVFAFSFANLFAEEPTSRKYEATELEKLGYNVLYDLDKQGLLPRFVYNQEWQNLTAALRVSLPLDVYFNLTVYYLNGTEVNPQPIFYGHTESFTNSTSIASTTYGLTGFHIKTNATHRQADYDPRTLILQLTRG